MVIRRGLWREIRKMWMRSSGGRRGKAVNVWGGGRGDGDGGVLFCLRGVVGAGDNC